MSYQPHPHDQLHLTKTAEPDRVYTVDQVLMTDEGELLGVVLSTKGIHRPRVQFLYDGVTLAKLGPVKIIS